MRGKRKERKGPGSKGRRLEGRHWKEETGGKRKTLEERNGGEEERLEGGVWGPGSVERRNGKREKEERGGKGEME